MASTEDFPFPIDCWPTIDEPAERMAAYEQTLVRLLTEWIEQRGGAVHGQSGLLLSVHLDGSFPETRLTLHYRSHAGGDYDPRWPVWRDGLLTRPAVGDDRPYYESPSSHGGLIAMNWDDGSIRAHDDPYWAAVERQRQAVREWRAAFPDAAAARVHSVGDRAAAMRWREQFPEASAAWAAIGPIENYLDD